MYRVCQQVAADLLVDLLFSWLSAQKPPTISCQMGIFSRLHEKGPAKGGLNQVS